MIVAVLVTIAAITVLCVVAYTLAVYALPFMIGVAAAQAAYHSGSGLPGAALVGLFAAGVAFGILALLFEKLRSPVSRFIVALLFAGPAAVAGYALIYGITEKLVPSPIWRQIFCIAGGAFVGLAALARLAAPPGGPMSSR